MSIVLLKTAGELEGAAEIALAAHRKLAEAYPWIPRRRADEYIGRISWIRDNGEVFGYIEDGILKGFMGYFVLDNFRNEGPGMYTPDWCAGTAGDTGGYTAVRSLLRRILAENSGKKIPIHGISVSDAEKSVREILGLTGYGYIVLDAGRPSAELLNCLKVPPEKPGRLIRRAEHRDAESLAMMAAELRDHIGASPVLMPDPRSRTAGEFESWMNENEAVAFVAFEETRPVGYIMAQEPQFDVTFTVHSSRTLAINGMYVVPSARKKGVGSALLRAMAQAAATRGKDLVSVDCETLNPEAYAFWTAYFKPLSWSMQRRIAVSPSS